MTIPVRIRKREKPVRVEEGEKKQKERMTKARNELLEIEEFYSLGLGLAIDKIYKTSFLSLETSISSLDSSISGLTADMQITKEEESLQKPAKATTTNDVHIHKSTEKLDKLSFSSEDSDKSVHSATPLNIDDDMKETCHGEGIGDIESSRQQLDAKEKSVPNVVESSFAGIGNQQILKKKRKDLIQSEGDWTKVTSAVENSTVYVDEDAKTESSSGKALSLDRKCTNVSRWKIPVRRSIVKKPCNHQLSKDIDEERMKRTMNDLLEIETLYFLGLGLVIDKIHTSFVIELKHHLLQKQGKGNGVFKVRQSTGKLENISSPHDYSSNELLGPKNNERR